MTETTTETSAAFRIPDSQKLHYRVTPQDGCMMTAQSVGGQIVALGDMLKTIAEQDDKMKWHVGISRAQTNEDGSFEFELVLAPEKPKHTLND